MKKKIKQKGSGIIPNAQQVERPGENVGVNTVRESAKIASENLKIIKTFSGDYPELSGGKKSKINNKLKIKKIKKSKINKKNKTNKNKTK